MQFIVSSQADPHGKSELTDYYRSSVFPSQWPSVSLVAGDNSHPLVIVMTSHIKKLTQKLEYSVFCLKRQNCYSMFLRKYNSNDMIGGL